MIFDHALVAAGDKDEVLDAGLARLVHHVLDQRPVDHWQHLLGHRLGGRKEARAEAGNRENRFADGFHAGGKLTSIHEELPKNWRDFRVCSLTVPQTYIFSMRRRAEIGKASKPEGRPR